MPLPENERLVRKLRKKLRQIEHLEIAGRELNDEELDKVGSKDDIRRELSSLLAVSRAEGQEEEEMKRTTAARTEAVKSKVAKLDKNEEISRSLQDDLAAENAGAAAPPNANQSEIRSRSEADQSEREIRSVTAAASRLEPPVEEVSSSSGSSPGEREEVSSSAVNLGAAAKFSKNNKTTTPPSASSERNKDKTAKPVSAVKRWRQLVWTAAVPGGQLSDDELHADLILDCDVDVAVGVAVTASRDTTLKVWDLSGGGLVHSLRGHSGPVTGVRLVPGEEASRNLAILLDEDVQEMVVSSSKDCTIRLWNLSQGTQLKSIYTFNGITRLQILPHRLCSVTGTDGGKLEMFSLATGLACFSTRVHEDEVTALSYRRDSGGRDLLVSGSRSGQIKLFQIAEDVPSLVCLFTSDNLSCDSLETSLHVRPVYSTSIGAGGNWLYYGDDGCNIKAVDWIQNRVRKIVNHVQDVGFTDCVLTAGQLLVATSYDIDTGEGMVNLFLQEEEEGEVNSMPSYLATLSQPATTRITSMAATLTSGGGVLLVVACGRELRLWQGNQVEEGGNRNTSDLLRWSILSIERARLIDSGSEEEEEEEDQVEEAVTPATAAASSLAAPSKPGSGFCNCLLM